MNICVYVLSCHVVMPHHIANIPTFTRVFVLIRQLPNVIPKLCIKVYLALCTYAHTQRARLRGGKRETERQEERYNGKNRGERECVTATQRSAAARTFEIQFVVCVCNKNLTAAMQIVEWNR